MTTPVTDTVPPGPGNAFDQWAEVARRANAIPQGHQLYGKAQEALAAARTQMRALIGQHQQQAAQYGAAQQDEALTSDVTPSQTSAGNIIDQLTFGAGRVMSGVGRMLSTATAADGVTGGPDRYAVTPGAIDPETHRPIAQYQPSAYGAGEASYDAAMQRLDSAHPNYAAASALGTNVAMLGLPKIVQMLRGAGGIADAANVVRPSLPLSQRLLEATKTSGPIAGVSAAMRADGSPSDRLLAGVEGYAGGTALALAPEIAQGIATGGRMAADATGLAIPYRMNQALKLRNANAAATLATKQTRLDALPQTILDQESIRAGRMNLLDAALAKTKAETPVPETVPDFPDYGRETAARNAAALASGETPPATIPSASQRDVMQEGFQGVIAPVKPGDIPQRARVVPQPTKLSEALPDLSHFELTDESNLVDPHRAQVLKQVMDTRVGTTPVQAEPPVRDITNPYAPNRSRPFVPATQAAGILQNRAAMQAATAQPSASSGPAQVQEILGVVNRGAPTPDLAAHVQDLVQHLDPATLAHVQGQLTLGRSLGTVHPGWDAVLGKVLR